jgi:y4mF family transcriptional regulator
MIMGSTYVDAERSQWNVMRLRKPNEIGGLVRERREDLGWSQSELAEKAGVSRQWISLVERGKVSVDLDLVFQTLRILGFDLHAELRQRDPASHSEESVAGLTHKPGRTPLTAGGSRLGRSGRRGSDHPDSRQDDE